MKGSVKFTAESADEVSQSEYMKQVKKSGLHLIGFRKRLPSTRKGLLHKLTANFVHENQMIELEVSNSRICRKITTCHRPFLTM